MVQVINEYKIWPLLSLGIALRVVVLLFGLWMDSRGSAGLRFTDIDYEVFSGAGRNIYEGMSPYHQGTFRYPPLLALLMVPNEFIWSGCGKLIFCIADISIIPAIYRLTAGEYVASTKTRRPWHFESDLFCSFIWAVNPISIIICTRGSCDSLANCLLLWILCSMKKKDGLAVAGLAYGLLIHFRVYPIIYVPAFAWHLTEGKIRQWKHCITFIMCTIFSFSYFTIASMMCDSRFIQEAVWYHLHRLDHRHNFSAYFYSIYLSASAESQSKICGKDELMEVGKWGAFGPFLPQAGLLLLLAIRLGRQHLHLCLLLSTMTFVAYNKVITAQYFTWYTCLVPLILPDLRRTPNLGKLWWLGGAFIAWGSCATVWLWRAYLLEMQGLSTFLSIHYTSLAFHVAHVALIAALFVTSKLKTNE